MIDSALLALLILLLVMGTCASTGWDIYELRNRENWWWTCTILIEALLLWPINPYAALLLGTVILGLWQIGRSWYILRMKVIPVAGVVGFYALVAPHMRTWMVPYLLWTGTAIGLFLAAWGALGLYIEKRPFRILIPVRFKYVGMWGIYEDLEGGNRHLCGQAHPCHLTSQAAFAMACAGGLVWLGYYWTALPALVACYLPMHLVYKADIKVREGQWRGHPHVGHLALMAAGIAALALWHPISAGVLLSSGVLVAGVMTWKQQPWNDPKLEWWDSGRLRYWLDVIRLCWWPFGWRHRLFGFGTSTWFLRTLNMAEARHAQVYTSAHNEYLQQLVEHGLVGVAALLVYLGEALWRNGTGVPAQQAVVLVGAAWCAVALVHFPAVFYHEYHSRKETKEHWYGSPPLNVWSLVIALLMEAR